ncbi:hypothetical protein FB451DRAFT_1172992 [Mycena latifolia]|nr:hypothetical protein FB451DRAFT_1172992 [Mycena latifolia]
MTRLEVPDAKSKARWNSPTQSPRRRGEMESGNVTMSHHRPELLDGARSELPRALLRCSTCRKPIRGVACEATEFLLKKVVDTELQFLANHPLEGSFTPNDRPSEHSDQRFDLLNNSCASTTGSSLKFALGNADSNPDTRATHPSEFATQMSSPNLCASLYLRVAIFHSISPPGRDLVLYTPSWRPRTPAADEAMKLGRLIRLQEFMRRQHRWEQRPVRDMLKSAGLAISLLCPACHK